MRIRSIKPEFWTNEPLASIEPEACLLAIGLLNFADDHGYFRMNQRLIHAAIFPLRYLYHTVPVLLRELYRIGWFEVARSTDGELLGHVVNFNKHQYVQKRQDSRLKPRWGDPMVSLPDDYVTGTVLLPSGSGVGEQGTGNREQGRGTGKPADPPHPSAVVPPVSREAKEPPIPYDDIVAAYHEKLPMLGKCRAYGPGTKVREHIAARWNADPQRRNVAWWIEYFADASERMWLVGKGAPGEGKKPFMASLPWLVLPTNMEKVLNGSYPKECDIPLTDEQEIQKLIANGIPEHEARYAYGQRSKNEW